LPLGKEWREYLELVRQRPEEFRQDTRLKLVLNETCAESFEQECGQKIGVLYRSPYHILVADLVEAEGRLFRYERILPAAAGSVVAVPVWEGRFLLLRQFRHAIRQLQYGFPRGFGEPGIPARDNVKKELAEELHAPVHAVRRLGVVTADSGLSGGWTEVFLCRVGKPEIAPPYEGIVSLEALTRAELEEWIRRGEITDGFTLAAYGLLCCGEQPAPDARGSR
jgi:ADP-ribose pyrophosphatase